MLSVSYNISDVLHSKQFSNDKKGNIELLAFVETLRDNHISHPYFNYLPEIKKIRDKISGYDKYTISFATYRSWQSKVSKLERLRKDYLKDSNISEPYKLTVSITSI